MEETITILMLGYYSGKSCFCRRFFDNIFQRKMPATIGLDSKRKKIELSNGKEIYLRIYMILQEINDIILLMRI